MDKENRFYKARVKSGLKQYQAAQKLNLCKSAVSKWECNTAIPEQPMLSKVADLYHVTIDYLLGREPEFTGLNIVKPLAPLKKSEIQILFDALGPEEQASVLGYAKGFLARSGKDYKKIIAEAYRRNDISDNY